MPISIPQYTVDDLDSWAPDENRYELLDGYLLVSPSPEARHQVVASRLAAVLTAKLNRWPDVLVTGPGAIIIRPKTQLLPDILVFRAPEGPLRWERVRERFLAVEVASPSTLRYDRDFKAPAYHALGVAEVWLVDIDQRAIVVSSPRRDESRSIESVLEWSPSGLGQVLRVELAALFAGLD